MLFLGEMLLFIRGVAYICYRVELFSVPLVLYFLLFFVVYVYCLPYDWVVFVNTWQKGGEIDEIWESCWFGKFFYLGEDESVFLKKGENKSFVCVYVYLT